MSIALIVLIVLVVLLVLYAVVTFNGLVRLRNQCRGGLLRHRRAAQAPARPDPEPGRDRQGLRRARAAGVRERDRRPQHRGRRARARRRRPRPRTQLTGALRQLFAVAEDYPDLKASQNFLELQNELTDTEDKIQAARRFYNMTVRDLNMKVEQFPSSVIAGMRATSASASSSSSRTRRTARCRRCRSARARRRAPSSRRAPAPAGSAVYKQISSNKRKSLVAAGRVPAPLRRRSAGCCRCGSARRRCSSRSWSRS